MSFLNRPLRVALVVATIAAPLPRARAVEPTGAVAADHGIDPAQQPAGSADAVGAPGAGAARIAARAPPAAPAVVASWRTRLVAHLARHRRYPRGAPAGSATVRFTIGRDGRVLSAALSESTGSAALDGEAIAMVWRASPLPPPPDEMGVPVSLTLPVRYRR